MRFLAKNFSSYSPLLFLNSLGAGGLAISFYMYLMWMTPHQGSPIPSFGSLMAALQGGGVLIPSLVVIGMAGVALFSAYHVGLLVWNVRRFWAWKDTLAYSELRRSNGETQLMALPLTYAMTINVLFIACAIFVPNLWEAREFLFPVALIGFLAVGIYALRLYLTFITRVLTDGGFDCAKNNSLGQMISVFAFSMIGVGFSSVAAMSHDKSVLALGFFGAVFFISVAVFLGAIKIVLGFRAMMKYKTDAETTPTLWVIIPILTVIGIAVYRLKMSLIHNFDVKISPAEIAVFLAVLFSIQLFFGLIGWFVMKRAKYMERWVDGNERSAGVYALVCPGVALFVLANFVINIGLVKTGLLDPMSAAYGAFYIPLVYLQAITVRLFFKLNKKMLKP
ncbi:MAG: hypothetical protein WC464_08065 [Bdellovibrionales bacterium]